MQWLRIAFIAVNGLWLLPPLADCAHAQGNSSRRFVPGELIVGYKSPQDREAAIQEMRGGGDKVRVRGETPKGVQVEKFGADALTIHIDFPEVIKRSTRGDPASELALLKEVARQLKENDSRVEYAQPNYVTPLDLPIPPPPQDGRLKLQSLEVDTSAPKATPGVAPNDPLFTIGLHWHYQPPPKGMNAVGAWNLSKGSRDIVVAVLDSGILFDHPDIAGSGNFLRGYSFVTFNDCGEVIKWGPDATDPGDERDGNCAKTTPEWHGTHVAGTIGAAGSNNGLGMTGVAWRVSVLPVRVIGPQGGGDTDLISALKWAAGIDVDGVPKNDHPAHIINLSLGAKNACTDHPGVIKAIKEVREQGTVIVVSAGNGEYLDADNKTCVPAQDNPQCRKVQDDIKDVYPAGCPGVISVAASDISGHLAYYSNYGAVTIMAPGGDIRKNGEYQIGTEKNQLPLGVWSGINGWGPRFWNCVDNVPYCAYQGTSQAAPHVSGAIALALAKHREWRGKPDLIEQQLRATAAKPVAGACPEDKPCGAGQLDAAALVAVPCDFATPECLTFNPNVSD